MSANPIKPGKKSECLSESEIFDIIESKEVERLSPFLKHVSQCPSCARIYKDFNLINERSDSFFLTPAKNVSQQKNADQIMKKIENLSPSEFSQDKSFFANPVRKILVSLIIYSIVSLYFHISKAPLNLPEAVPKNPASTEFQKLSEDPDKIIILEARNIGNSIKMNDRFIIPNQRQELTSRGSIILKLPTGGTIRITGISDFSINSRQLTVKSGKVEFQANQKALSYIIKTPQSEILTTSGQFNLSISPSESSFRVNSGSIRVSSKSFNGTLQTNFSGKIGTEGQIASNPAVSSEKLENHENNEFSTSTDPPSPMPNAPPKQTDSSNLSNSLLEN
ncbi:MAG: hypothetical protein HQM08_11985 [Candidatus Riflebacteria bacterium]|nr:hypothetical protein [Candidatus Riflebacteria bacterium]